jgi:hypothetical protein
MTVDCRIIDLYNEYVHTALPRLEFLTRLASIAGSSAAAMAVLPFIEPDDLGPVLVFSFGKGFDSKKLAFCDG